MPRCSLTRGYGRLLFFFISFIFIRRIFFEPLGIKRAFIDAKNKYGITSLLILCIVRDRSEEDALEALEKCLRKTFSF